MTLDGIYRPLFCVILPISVALGPIMSNWLKLDPYCLQQKCSPKNLRYDNIIMIYGNIPKITEKQRV